MEQLQQNIEDTFGNRVRLRVCGICIRGNEILLVKHKGIGKGGYLWAPPGGGVQFGENMQQTLVREVYEETGLSAEVQEFLFINEYYRNPLHAIEVFFKIKITEGVIQKGSDPEMQPGEQIIEDVAFVDIHQTQNQAPHYYHNLFRYARTPEEIINLSGYLKNIEE